MSESVAHELIDKAPSLFEKLAGNFEMAKLVMGIVGNIVWTCYRKNRPVSGVLLGDISESGGEFRFKVMYGPFPLANTGIWQFGSDLVSYVQSKSESLARAVHDNPAIVRKIIQLVDMIEKFSDRKGTPFHAIRIKKSFVTKEDVFVIVMGKQSLDRWGR